MPTIHSAHILSHTHWDREWYLNSPYTNPWLVPFFESLFKMLDKEPGYRFVLDGQTSMIEDWVEQLEVRGENSASYLQRLGQYTRQGRVCVGPYYLQPDWQLVSEESLVRNLLIGQQMAGQLGGRMNVGWLLDNFGQISQTAQIHREFGLDGLFVWRGVEMDPREIKSEFTWEAPDGSQVTAIYLVASYRNGMRLAEYAGCMAGRIAGEIKKLAPFATTPNILLMNGYDQEMLPDDILPMLNSASNQFGDVRVIQSTPQDYVDAILNSGSRLPLPILRGALYSGRYISVFPGILSSRMYLKLQNDACQKLLEKSAEPLAAALWALGAPYPAADLDRAWRLLLKNHPHDSICGVSIDDVHTDMEERFKHSEEIAKRLTVSALGGLCANINTDAQPGALKRWVVFNTALKPTGGLVEIKTSRQGQARFVDGSGVALAAQTTASGACLVSLPTVPALGYQTVYALEQLDHAELIGYPTDGDAWLRVDRSKTTIENAWIKVAIDSDGALNLIDKVNHVTYPNLMIFEDGGDAGDTYNTSYPRHDLVLTSRAQRAEMRYLETGPLRARLMIQHRLQIPRELAPDRSARSAQTTILPIHTIVTVEANSPLVSFHTTVSNTARDHRLRVLFPTGIQTSVSHAETQFDVVTRQITAQRYDDSTIPENVKQVIIGAREPEPVTIYPQRAFVDVNDSKRGLAVLNQGLPEIEILPDQNTIALTLFRGVEWIARPDLLTRIGDAGPLIAVPGAQCLRKMAFDYAVLPHTGDWQTGGLVQIADQFNSRLLVVETGAHTGLLAPCGGFLRLDDPVGQLKVTAVKRSEDGRALVVRLHNPTPGHLEAKIWSSIKIRQACTANLAESPAKPIPVQDEHYLPLSIEPKKIVTILIELTPGSAELISPTPGITLSEEVGGDWDDFPGLEPPPSIRLEDITREERRAADLAAVLAQKDQLLQDALAQGETTGSAGLLRLYALRLEAATYRRTALEARLSETLLKKNAWLAQREDPSSGADILAAYEDTLRQIGDAINSARVEKRALEYVVDYYSKLVTTP